MLRLVACVALAAPRQRFSVRLAVQRTNYLSRRIGRPRRTRGYGGLEYCDSPCALLVDIAARTPSTATRPSPRSPPGGGGPAASAAASAATSSDAWRGDGLLLHAPQRTATQNEDDPKTKKNRKAESTSSSPARPEARHRPVRSRASSPPSSTSPAGPVTYARIRREELTVVCLSCPPAHHDQTPPPRPSGSTKATRAYTLRRPTGSCRIPDEVPIGRPAQ